MSKNRQQIFNEAYLGLASQGFVRSIAAETDLGAPLCMYRGFGGRKCAVGWCIPDSAYTEELEGIVTDNVLAAAGIDEDDRAFVADLQMVHDLSSQPTEMRRRLEDFARENGLTIPEGRK